MAQQHFLKEIGSISSPDGDLPVYRGWTNILAERLVAQSSEDGIPPRDASERFADLTAANRWHASKKRPVPYSLGREALHGFIWFSLNQNPAVPDADYTMGIRMYLSARGKGLSKEFATIAHADLEERYQPFGIWLETDDTNKPALHLYESLGYEKVASVDGRITMVRRRKYDK